jgi:hypothetical protein
MQYAMPWQPIGDRRLWWHAAIYGVDQCLSKNQLQLPDYGPICWFVEWAWLLQVRECTLVLMAALTILYFSDSVSGRALQVMVDAGDTTVESCVAACQAQQFSLAGVEYGKECCVSISQPRVPVVIQTDDL